MKLIFKNLFFSAGNAVGTDSATMSTMEMEEADEDGGSAIFSRFEIANFVARLKLNTKFELHRRISFMLTGLDSQEGFELAKNGFFAASRNKIKCSFCEFIHVEICNFEGIIEKVESHHRKKSPSCRGSRTEANVRMPRICNDYSFESFRLYSFATILSTVKFNVSIVDLVKNGFHYVGPNDNVRCFFCKLEIRGWETEDTAEGEHRLFNPHCPFLKGLPVKNVKIGEENFRNEGDRQILGSELCKFCFIIIFALS
jgi:hypothetical protein